MEAHATAGHLSPQAPEVTDADLYRYAAVITRVIDGDTFIADIDCGFRMWLRDVSVRVLGIDTPEVTGTDRPRGEAARAFATGVLLGRRVFLHSTEYDSFGRVLAAVWLPDGRRLDEVLREEGHVK